MKFRYQTIPPECQLEDRIAAVIRREVPCHPPAADRIAREVTRELNIPDRTHVDDQGRTWEWCGGQPGTWAWRITRTGPEPLHSMYPRNPEGYDCEAVTEWNRTGPNE